MKRPILVCMLFILIGLGLVCFVAINQRQSPGCEQLTKNICLTLEHARTPEALTRGLGGRNSLPPSYAMLFIYAADAPHGIWMKDMRFAIDIVWLDSDKRIIHQLRNVSPATYPTVFRPRTPARYVLELTANTSPWQNGEQLQFDTD
jgi:uncharacterized membrane protein (UPF0127 family)